MYGSRFRVLSGGSKWLRALPGGGSECVQAQPARKTKKSTAPMYGSRFRVLSGGSKWLRALPGGGSKWLSALPTGSRWLSALPTCPVRP